MDLLRHLRPKTGIPMSHNLKVISLGGVHVNKNMYVYETERDIIIVDCGLAFPHEDMPGIDLIIPDITYLLDRRQKIRALFLTHGHEDHTGALPYILPQLGNIPIYGSKLTLGLAQNKVNEVGITTSWNPTPTDQTVTVGDFRIQFVHVTHSIPDATNLIIQTPAGIIYHGSDFKFDWTPVDGKPTEVQKIASAGKDGILLLLSDCLRVEKSGYTLPEKMIEETFDRQIQKSKGKFIVTTQSSNISRIQQAVNVSQRYGRKIVFAGRSIEQNCETAVRLCYLSLPQSLVIKTEDVGRFKPNQVTVLATGAQGQPNSALSRMANHDHKIKIEEGDMIVFSQDPIPGSESDVDNLIESLIRSGAEVFYSSILDDLHVSGHEAAEGLKLMLALTNPKYVYPIGGTLRHIKRYRDLAVSMGYKTENIIMPDEGEVLEIKNGVVSIRERIKLKNILVDGLGIGDVGQVVLRDRQHMSADGMLMVIIPMDKTNREVIGEIDIVSRGFVYMKESEELINDAKKVVMEAIGDHKTDLSDTRFLRSHIERRLEDFLYKETRRNPMILPVVVEI
jgi:ribonuclease J